MGLLDWLAVELAASGQGVVVAAVVAALWGRVGWWVKRAGQARPLQALRVEEFELWVRVWQEIG